MVVAGGSRVLGAQRSYASSSMSGAVDLLICRDILWREVSKSLTYYVPIIPSRKTTTSGVGWWVGKAGQQPVERQTCFVARGPVPRADRELSRPAAWSLSGSLSRGVVGLLRRQHAGEASHVVGQESHHAAWGWLG